MLSTIVRSVCAVTLLALTAAPAIAQTPLDKPVLFTFSAPVTLPGVTLPAGTYMFHLGDPLHGRSVVHVRSKDGTEVYSTFLTIPSIASERPEEPEIRFMERRANVPHAVKAWWYPGDRTGFQPVSAEAGRAACKIDERSDFHDERNGGRRDRGHEAVRRQGFTATTLRRNDSS
jgi:hypothetical protein